MIPGIFFSSDDLFVFAVLGYLKNVPAQAVWQ
jgi:hypothetical protein